MRTVLTRNFNWFMNYNECHCILYTSPTIGYSAILTMGSDGFVSVYSLPDLKLIYKEDCVDASDAIGQRNFTMARNGTLLHQRSPSEFTRGSMTEDARLEFHFSLPSKHISPLMLTPNTPKSMNGEPIFEVTHVSSTNAQFKTTANLYCNKVTVTVCIIYPWTD